MDAIKLFWAPCPRSGARFCAKRKPMGSLGGPITRQDLPF